MDEMIDKIRQGEIDCNNQQLFFSILIKGLLLSLNNTIYIQNNPVKHMIISTGSDQIYLSNKGQDASIEPLYISNEDYIYNVVPRCIVKPGSINLESDQTTNPHIRGLLQLEYDNSIYTLSAEFRRMPIKMSIELKYYLNTFTELLELTQQLISKLSFIRTFSIIYMGQMVKCSYRLPDDFQGEYLSELDGTTNDNKTRSMSLSIDLETNFPVYENRTVIDGNKVIKNTICNYKL